MRMFIYLETRQRSALPEQTFHPAGVQVERQLGVRQGLYKLPLLFKTEGPIAKNPVTETSVNTLRGDERPQREDNQRRALT